MSKMVTLTTVTAKQQTTIETLTNAMFEFYLSGETIPEQAVSTLSTMFQLFSPSCKVPKPISHLYSKLVSYNLREEAATLLDTLPTRWKEFFRLFRLLRRHMKA